MHDCYFIIHHYSYLFHAGERAETLWTQPVGIGNRYNSSISKVSISLSSWLGGGGYIKFSKILSVALL